MVFDENLSTEVSLSRILDHFIVSGENPDIILSFLELHEEKIEDIIKCSDCSPRFLSIDFVRNLSVHQNEKMAKLLDGVKNGEVDSLLWQVFLSKSIDQKTKDIYRKITKLESNPYHGRTGSETLAYDRIFLESVDSADYVVALDGITNSGILDFMRYLYSSIVIPRIFQEDVFSKIDPIRQFVLLNSFQGKRVIPISVFKGFKQLLSGYLEPEIKLKICKVISENGQNFSDWAELLFLVDENTKKMVDLPSFNQIAMKLELGGGDRFCDWILFHLLCKRGLDFLKRCSRGHRHLFEKYFNILDIVNVGENDKSTSSDS